MNRQAILDMLHAHMHELTQRFDVQSLALFGSAGRDQLGGESDIDLCVTFKHGATFRGYFALKFYLQDLLGREVDLATDKMIKPAVLPRIEGDMIRVA